MGPWSVVMTPARAEECGSRCSIVNCILLVIFGKIKLKIGTSVITLQIIIHIAMLLENLPTYALILLMVLACIIFGLLMYYLAFYGKFVFRKEKKHILSEEFPPISIVIVAHDEAHHLLKTLPELLTQDYPHYEVVLVNDNSSDETPQLAIEMKNRYHNLHYVNMTSSVSTIEGQKFPLAIGIQAAQYELVLLTGPSCQPSSPYWLRQVAGRFVRRTRVVLGHATYGRRAGLFNKLLHYDALENSVIAFSYTISGMPVMADGRNLAYNKDLFFKNKEIFFRHSQLPFGEDNIFINEAVKRDACNVVASPEAVMEQYPIEFSKWFQLKKFALISRTFYKVIPQILLHLYNWLCFLFHPAAIAAIVITGLLHNWIFLGIVAAAILLKMGMQYWVFTKGATKLGERDVLPGLLLYDLLLTLLRPWIYLGSKFEKAKWK